MRRGTPLVIAALACASSAFAQESAQLSLRLSPHLSTDAVAHAAAPAAPAAPMAVAPAAIDAAARSGLGEYRIGAEDLVEIQVFGVDQLARTVRVNSFGLVSLPLIGAVSIGGMTATEAERVIGRKLAESYLQDPQVSVFIKEYTNQRVTVEGAVQKPGIYPLRGQTTLIRALAVAGGQGSLSDLSNVVIYRTDASGARTSQTYDVERIRRGDMPDPTVLNDDVIVVNRSPTRVVLKDSVFRDILDAVNPFSYVPAR